MMNKKLVLIVEDDEDVRQGLALLFGCEFRVVCAEDSISALMIARRDRPDAMVLDLGLPGGDGLQLLSRLRQIPGLTQTPTVVVTGRDGDDVDSQALALGASQVFRKPADPNELIDAVRELSRTEVASGRRALIVEDDPDTRESLTVRLRANDWDVTHAADGASALMIANKSPPDLILLDLGIPCGGGYKVLDRLRALPHTASVPVVVLSARDPEECREEALAKGAAAYLQKPADDEELMAVIQVVS